MARFCFLSHPCYSGKAIYLYKWIAEGFVVCLGDFSHFGERFIFCMSPLVSGILKLQTDNLFFHPLLYVSSGEGMLISLFLIYLWMSGPA